MPHARIDHAERTRLKKGIGQGLRGQVAERIEAVPETAGAAQIESALHAVAEGLTVFDEMIARTAAPQGRAEVELEEPLTHRELEVLQLLAGGLTNKEIAQRLGISDHTVKFHVNAILGKLGVETRTEAVVHAARLGIVVI